MYFKFYSKNYLFVVLNKIKTLIGSILSFNLVNYWARNSDNLIIGKFFGSEMLGIYNRAYNILIIPVSIFQSVFGSVFYASLIKIKKDKNQVEHELLFILKAVSLICIFIIIALVNFNDYLVYYLWGMKWHKVAELLPYIGILVYLQSLISPFGNIFIIYEKEKNFAKIGILSAILMVLSIILGSIYSFLSIIIFYSLFSILINSYIFVFLGLVNILSFNKTKMTVFWLPKISFCFLLWLSLILNQNLMQIIVMTFFFIYVILDSKEVLQSFYRRIL